MKRIIHKMFPLLSLLLSYMLEVLRQEGITVIT